MRNSNKREARGGSNGTQGGRRAFYKQRGATLVLFENVENFQFFKNSMEIYFTAQIVGIPQIFGSIF